MVGFESSPCGSEGEEEEEEDIVSLRVQYLEDADPFRLHVYPQPLRPRAFDFHAQLILRNQIPQLIQFLGCGDFFAERVSSRHPPPSPYSCIGNREGQIPYHTFSLGYEGGRRPQFIEVLRQNIFHGTS